jgi:periplasmic divalent cation tolerance protein
MANGLLDQKYIVCANIFPMTSLYNWEGKREEKKEVILLVKTLKEKVKEVEEKITELHSYDCPCVLSLNVETVNNAYMEWCKQCLM